MSKSPSLRRIQADIRELALDPSDRYHAAPLENDMFEWHFTIRGADGTDFEGGVYHGRILLPPEYPFKPPHIIFLTPSGRFETNTKVCLSFSAYHPELWQPAWGIRLILEALISFLPTKADGAIGALDWSPTERKRLAKLSREYICPTCQVPNVQLLPKLKPNKSVVVEDPKKPKTRFQKEIEELQRLQREAREQADATAAAAAAAATEQVGRSSTGEEQAEQTTAAKAKDKDDHRLTPEKELQDKNNTVEREPTIATTTTGEDKKDNVVSSDKDNDKDKDGHEPKLLVKEALSSDGSAQVSASTTPALQETTTTTAAARVEAAAGATTTTNTTQTQPQPVVVQEDAVVEQVPLLAVNNEPQPLNQAHQDHDPSWMYDPLLNLMIVLMAVIGYLLVQKYQELMAELQDLQQQL